MRLMTLILTLVLTSTTWAADLKPITQEEAREGWLALFDGQTTYGWTSPNESKWSIYKGMLAPQKGKEGQLLTTSAFRNYELKMEFLRRPSSRMELIALADKDGWPVDNRMIIKPDGFFSGWTRLILRVNEGNIIEQTYESIGRLNGLASGRGAEEQPNKPKGAVGRLLLRGNGFIVRKMVIRPLNRRILFNGRDLTGWKVYQGNPGREKSKFAVEDGILRVTNGPGDLQTKEQFADFILQLECKTNGKHLNSGIFFRGLPNEYQQGYESQIQNGFFEDKKKTYTLNVYDPKTHELKEKVKVESTAMDFGTGGIYRRSLARKKMANDNEWFSMTVLAHERHFATWVNGIQVADWTDNRPLSENARQGCRLKKGVISIQGHDPTTDLSFRNFRLAPLSESSKVEN